MIFAFFVFLEDLNPIQPCLPQSFFSFQPTFPSYVCFLMQSWPNLSVLLSYRSIFSSYSFCNHSFFALSLTLSHILNSSVIIPTEFSFFLCFSWNTRSLIPHDKIGRNTIHTYVQSFLLWHTFLESPFCLCNGSCMLHWERLHKRQIPCVSNQTWPNKVVFVSIKVIFLILYNIFAEK